MKLQEFVDVRAALVGKVHRVSGLPGGGTIKVEWVDGEAPESYTDAKAVLDEFKRRQEGK